MSHRVKERKVGKERNDSCACGSGKKYKKCCGANRTTKGESPSLKTPIRIKPSTPAPRHSQAEFMTMLAIASHALLQESAAGREVKPPSEVHK